MKQIITFPKVLLLAGLFVSLSFSSRADYVLNGSASSTGNDCFIVTPNQFSTGGSVWYDNFLLLSYDFDMTFMVYLGDNDAGADGIAFVLQPNSTAAGGIGGGIGYLGISPSIAVEYDTWQNDDPSFDHISVQRNGDVNYSGSVAGPVQASSNSVNIEDGQWHSTRIVWNSATKTLTVYFDDVLRLSYNNDIVANTFGGDPKVYWGFTGATGGAKNLQQFCVTSLFFEEAPTVPLSPWILGLSIFLILVVTVFRYRRNL